MTISQHFTDRLHADAVRGRFAFGATGARGHGTYYVNTNLTGDRATDTARAARIACKRAGAESVELMSISAPTR